MRSLNWPNLRMIGDNTGFVVKKIYIEYSYLDNDRMNFFREGEEAFRKWRGLNHPWNGIKRAQDLVEDQLDYLEQEDYGPSDWDGLEEFKQRANNFIELVSKIGETSFTYEDLLALGEQSFYLDLGDFDYYDSCSLILKPSEGRFYWDARRTDDETQIWASELNYLSKVNFN